ncbi:MAG: NFACT family protein, partial [Chlorobium sp.]|nr:NFACT family protein [Chlorobium sp.]
MLRNYFTLYHLARELHELVAGGYVFEVYSQQKSEITISLITNEGNHLQLIVVTGHPRLCVYTREGLQRKRRNTAGLMSELNEKKVAGITIDPCDRIIRIETEDNYAIVLQLFSAKTNIFLEHNGTLASSFKKGIARSGSGSQEAILRPDILRTLERMVQNRRHFIELFSGTDRKDTEIPVQLLPGFDRGLIKELLGRCGKNRSPETIHEQLSTLFYELIDPCPSVLSTNENGPLFSILQQEEKESVEFDSVIEGLNFYSSETRQHRKTVELVHQIEGKLLQKRKKIDSELQHFQPDLLQRQFDAYQRYGHLLMANLSLADCRRESITVPDIFDPSALPVTIALKPELNLQENAALWFRKASRTREKLQGGSRRIAAVAEEKQTLEQLITELGKLAKPSEVTRFEKNNSALLKKLGCESTSGKAGKRLPFRSFELSEKAALYVGKN